MSESVNSKPVCATFSFRKNTKIKKIIEVLDPEIWIGHRILLRTSNGKRKNVLNNYGMGIRDFRGFRLKIKTTKRAHRPDIQCTVQKSKKINMWAFTGIEPMTTPTQTEYYTTKPKGRFCFYFFQPIQDRRSCSINMKT